LAATLYGSCRSEVVLLSVEWVGLKLIDYSTENIKIHGYVRA